MLATRLHVADPRAFVQFVVSFISNEFYDGNLRVDFGNAPSKSSVRFVLRCNSSRKLPARLSASGRLTVAANWEAHRRVMAMLFDAAPDMTLRTSMATYKGKKGFDALHPATYYKNVGSMMYPATYGEL